MVSTLPPPGTHITYSRQFRRCGKLACATCRDGAGHGPYWYAVWREEGRVRRRYLGANAPRDVAPPPDPAAHALPLRVRTLGGFSVSWSGQPLPAEPWRRRKAGSLFKALIGAPAQTLAREQLLELLWPEADPSAATRNLYTALHALRSILGDAAYLVSLEDDVLRLTVPSGSEWLDAQAFETRARAALAGEDAELSRRALDLYKGDYLPDDPYEEWVLARRDGLRDLHAALLLHLADLCGAQGNFAEAEACLHAVLAQDSCNEEATARLMGLLAAAGRRTDALRAYEQITANLARDLGVSPSRDLVALRARLRDQESAPVPATRPPRETRPPRLTNLPVALTSFVGRAREREEIALELARARLLTLTGAGGCGKTRLALETADRLVDAYADGVWLVELAALTADEVDRQMVARRIAATLGVKEEASRSLSATLAAFLAPRRLLLILDNCEHLLSPSAALVATLLTACPELKVLATSRERLGVPGEAVYHVDSLSIPPLDALDAALTGFEAVTLFLARAKAASVENLESAAARRAVAQICRTLDGIPLAIELAAARTNVYPVQALASRLDDCFHMLTDGPRTALPRQRTLHATLDWSYTLLSEPERVLLRRLAVFVGGWTLEAAEAVCPLTQKKRAGNPPDVAQDAVLDLTSSLVGKSLVHIEARSGEAHYRFLEPVRQYAHELCLAAGELPLLRDRHLDCYLALAEHAEPSLWGGAEQAACLDHLESEQENFRAALRWTVEQLKLSPGLRLAGALRRYWDIRGYSGEGSEWLETLLRMDDAAGAATPAARAKALVGSATLAYSLNSYDRATVRAEQGRALCRDLGNLEGVADCLNVLGMIASDKEDLDGATRLYEEALALYRPLGIKHRIAAMLCNLGNIAYFRGHYEQAIATYADALDLFRAIGDSVALAATLSNTGAAYRELGRLDLATKALEESLVHARLSSAAVETAHVLNNLGDVAFRGGNFARSADLMRLSAELFQECGDRRNVLASLVVLSEALIGLGQYERATCLAGTVAAQCEELGIAAAGSEWSGLQRSVQAAREQLGEKREADARDRGRRLTLEQAVLLART